MNNTVLSIDLIVSNPEVKRGRPVLVGTGIRVQDIAAAHVHKNRTPAEVAEDYAISLAQVHAALAHYFAHEEEIEGHMQADEEFILRAKEKGLGQRHKPLL